MRSTFLATVARAARSLVAIEVKSGSAAKATSGLTAFSERFNPTRTLLVGGDGIPLEEFLEQPVERWLGCEDCVWTLWMG